jgi:hypothetical protein
MTYSEKLKDPRWQRKRLEILNRDGFKCLDCGDNRKTLHVHHKSYASGRDPWSYPDDNFITLCIDCHSQAHKKTPNLLSFNTSDAELWESGIKPIICPVCNCDYVHLCPTSNTIMGNDNYDARPGLVRGGVMLIEGACEEGHRFNLAFGFHKGQTFTWCERLSHLPRNETSIDKMR